MSGRFSRWAPGGLRGLLLWGLLVGASCEQVDRSRPVIETPEIIVTRSGIEMVLIPAGRFVMGSNHGEPDQAPAHQVEVDAFLMDRHEVTQAAYAQVDPINGSHFKGPQLPTEMISWGKAALYCNLRSEAEGLEPCYNEYGECDFEANGYRLPTEAEWEHACRAGSDTTYSYGSDARRLKQHAWYTANAAKRTHAVETRKPNAWGLFGMHGNVAEWCNDFYEPTYYKNSPSKNPRGPAAGDKNVLRGGHWGASAEACGSAARFGEDPGFSDACFARDAIGFRCVRKAPRDLSNHPNGHAEPAVSHAEEGQSDRDGAPSESDRPAGKQTTDTGQQAATGFLFGEIYLRHKTGAGHPERPERLSAIVRRLKEKGLFARLVKIEPAPAAHEWLTAVHTPQYVKRVKTSCQQGAGHLDSMDTPVSEESYRAAVEAAGGVLAAVDAVMQGKVRNAFCAVRPPGHHALKDKAMGFCLFNNVAIAARYLQRKHKLSKILIVDWDVHHGNGTQAVFYDDPAVLYFSVHQFPFYPGTGSETEKGAGRGLNYTLNAPLPAGAGDREFLRVFEEVWKPSAAAFRPDFVLVSAGFDAHEDDPLGGMKVTAEGFARLTRIVKAIAERCCRGRLVSVLEGGYGLEGLAASAESHVRVLMD